MAPVGYCNECGDTVSLTDVGECQHGHPASSTVEAREAAPAFTPTPVSQHERAQSHKTLRIVLVVIASVIGVYLVAGAGLTWFVMSGKVSALFSEITPEWRSRLAEDYPGWKIVDVSSFRFDQPNGFAQRNYVVTATPPGESYSVGVLYHIDEEGRLVSDDSIFRRDALFQKRVPSLLDYLRINYVNRDKRIVWVDSSGSGPAYVNWEYVHPTAPAAESNGAIDWLEYDRLTDSWKAY